MDCGQPDLPLRLFYMDQSNAVEGTKEKDDISYFTVAESRKCKQEINRNDIINYYMATDMTGFPAI